MKKLLIILSCAAALTACGGRYGAGVPKEYYPLLDAAMEKAGGHALQLQAALRETPRGQRKGMAYLIAYMPAADLTTIDKEMLRDNVKYAYKAREEFPWTAVLPEEIFLNEVLPYANVDETRENWRPVLYDIFSRRVEGLTDIRVAIVAVNKSIPADTKVDYNTRREKTNQSPAESMRQNMASCTGLSILLVDALRSVGIPARFAGTWAWHDDRGNHSWVEVWVEGRWHFTEFYYPGQLDNAWFLADAGKGDPSDREHAIYAVSYKPTGDWFPMVWSKGSEEVPGVNVTERYNSLYSDLRAERADAGTHVPVTFIMFRDQGHKLNSDQRIAANVDVFRGAEQMGGGRTAGPLQDMNDNLVFELEKNHTYTFLYWDARGEEVRMDVALGEEPMNVIGVMEK